MGARVFASLAADDLALARQILDEAEEALGVAEKQHSKAKARIAELRDVLKEKTEKMRQSAAQLAVDFLPH